MAFTEGIDFETFVKDAKTYAATVRQIEIMGEAVYNLSESLKDDHPDIEWKNIEKTRHVLVHEYYALSDIIIWKIVKEYLPELLTKMQPIIERMQ